MTKYKDEYVIKIRRRVICWQECTYIISHPDSKKVIEIAENESLYRNSNSEDGIIYQELKIDENSIERLNQEKSWLLSSSCGIGEVPVGETVSKIIFATKRRSGKVPQTVKDENNINLKSKK